MFSVEGLKKLTSNRSLFDMGAPPADENGVAEQVFSAP
jgi:hypothetical protein